jgi:hypothetical protein
VSAGVFSAACQPVQAAPILIDNFTTGITGTTVTASTANFVFAQLTVPGSFGAWDTREATGSFQQTAAPRSGKTTSVGVFNSGTGTVLLGNNGAGTAAINFQDAYLLWSSSGTSSFNLTTGGNDALRIKTGAVSNNLGSMSAYVLAADANAQYWSTLPSNSFWTSFTTYNFPFSAFPGIDFTQLYYIQVGIAPGIDSSGSVVPVAGNVAYSSSATFTEISIVPEPTHLVLVAGVGAALGMWRLRKLRRNGEAAGDAIAS